MLKYIVLFISCFICLATDALPLIPIPPTALSIAYAACCEIADVEEPENSKFSFFDIFPPDNLVSINPLIESSYANHLRVGIYGSSAPSNTETIFPS